MSAQLVADRSRTLEEFKQLVESSETKYEYIDGEVWEWEMMAGATPPHSKICANATTTLSQCFRRASRRCTALTADTYISIPGEPTYRFPDVPVVCNDIEYDPEFELAITNPVALIEVISESSKDADRGSKFKRYSQIPSLRLYILIEQDYPQCHVHARDDGSSPWQTTVYFQLGSEVYLPHLDIAFPLSDLYDDLVWKSSGVAVVPGAGRPTYERRRG